MSKHFSSISQLNESGLINQAKQELPHITLAFEEIVSRYEKMVYAICLRYFGSVQQAEEVSQEVFLKLFQQINSFRGEAKFSTWLYRITINMCHTNCQKKTILFDDPVEDFADDIRYSQEFECNDEEQCIQYCINQQKEQEKAMISMRFNTDLSLQEISDILDIKLSATKMRLYRAMESFKALYEKFCK